MQSIPQSGLTLALPILSATKQTFKDHYRRSNRELAVRQTGSRAFSLRCRVGLDGQENAVQNTEVTTNSQNG